MTVVGKPCPMRLHLVDGTYELFRAHYAPRPDHKAPDGRSFKATVGLAASMLALLADREEAVTHIAIAFDNPIRSFRNDLFDAYKSDEGVEPVLREQFDAAEGAMHALGVAVWSMDAFEADDGLASGAARFKADVEQVRILTPDKDLGQCLEGQRVVQVDRRQKKQITEASFRETRGFAPQSMPDFLALVGDTADGIPGLPGFGEKSTSQLLAVYPHLEDIPKHPHQWRVKPRGALGLAHALVQQYENALLYRKLATLVADAPLPHTLEQLAFAGVPRARFAAWCDTLGVNSLRSVPKRWSDSD